MPRFHKKIHRNVFFKTLFFFIFLINLGAYSQIIDFNSAPKRSLEINLKKMVENPSIGTESLIRYVKAFNSYPTLQKFIGSHIFSINDSTFGTIPFKLHIPKNYNPNKPATLILLLHGAVGGSSFDDAKSDNTQSEAETDPFYQKLCNSGFVVIMPYGDRNKNFNWVMNRHGNNQNFTYRSLINIVDEVKKVVNVDENKIFAFGHSDGSDGAFALDVYLPTAFAGFVGYNSMLNILFANNFYVANAVNRPLYLVHSDKDDLRPIEQARIIVKLLDSLKVQVNYKEYSGYTHFDKHLNIDFPLSLNFIDSTERNPYPTNVYWDTNDHLYERCNWLSIKNWDLTLPNASWHGTYNTLAYNKVKHTWHDRYYYNLSPSATIKGNYNNNVFNIQTSRVTRFEILVSAEMVDLNKEIQVIVNGKLAFTGKVKPNKSFLANQFIKDQDRKAIWVNSISLDVKP